MVLLLLSLKMNFHFCRLFFSLWEVLCAFVHTHQLFMSKEELCIMLETLTKMRWQIASWLKATIVEIVVQGIRSEQAFISSFGGAACKHYYENHWVAISWTALTELGCTCIRA